MRSTTGTTRFSAETGQALSGPLRSLGARLEVWDCVEQGGFVWLFFGDRDTPMAARPDIPSVPELALPGALLVVAMCTVGAAEHVLSLLLTNAGLVRAPSRHDFGMCLRLVMCRVRRLSAAGWHAVHGEVRIKANHWTVIENVIDMAHVPYVHKGTVGNHAGAFPPTDGRSPCLCVPVLLVFAVPQYANTNASPVQQRVSACAAFVDIVIEQMPTAMNFSFPIENHTKDGKKAAFHVDTMATMCLPSTSFIRFHFPGDVRLVTINSVVPIDREYTCIRFCQMRNVLRTKLIDPVVLQYAHGSLEA